MIVSVNSTMTKNWKYLGAGLLIAVCVASTVLSQEPCPTWFYRSQEGEPESKNGCKCGDSVNGAVSCNNVTGEVSVLDCFCMTSNGDTSNTTVVGRCLFSCVNHTGLINDAIFHSVSPNNTLLDEQSCGYLNRKGRLCIDNFYIPVYSYSFKCIQCSKPNWLKYIAVAFIPLTGFYFLVVLFRLSVTSPQMKGFLYCAQFISSAPNARIILQILLHINSKISLLSARILFTMYGF